MKTLRLLVAVGLFTGAASAVLAQSNTTPQFRSEAEKQAWYDERQSTELNFNSEAEKEAWIKANPEKYRAMGSASASVKPAEKVINTVVIRSDAQRIDANVRFGTASQPSDRGRKLPTVSPE